MFTLDKFHNLFLTLQLLSETSYFKLKNKNRKINKNLLNIFYDAKNIHLKINKEKTFNFIKESVVFIDEDEDFIYLKNDYNILPITFKLYNPLFNELKKNQFMKILSFESLIYENRLIPIFNNKNEIIFPELFIIQKD